MTRARRILNCAAAMLLGIGLSGCAPGGGSQRDEQKEPHFLSGQNLVRERDYQGAIEAYEEALQVNPRSASAHFELAWLNAEKAGEPAAAIYHYQKFLKLCPATDSRADRARERINWCAQELAKNVSSSITLTPAAQSYLERLAQENRELKVKLARLAADNPNKTAMIQTNGLAPAPPADSDSAGQPAGGATRSRVAGGESASPKTHTVRPGDTLARIARTYGVSLGKLQAANPQAEATRLRVGATLRIPAP